MAIPALLDLEPLLGAGLAINLAYLNLSVFRYRDSMAKAAKEALDGVDSKAVGHYSWYKHIEACSLLDARKPPSFPPLRQAWARIFKAMFNSGLDRGVSVILTVVTALILLLAVAQQVGLFIPLSTTLSGWMPIWFWVCVLALIWPMLAVVLAHYCVNGCVAYFNDQTEQEADRLRDVASGTQEAALSQLNADGQMH